MNKMFDKSFINNIVEKVTRNVIDEARLVRGGGAQSSPAGQAPQTTVTPGQPAAQPQESAKEGTFSPTVSYCFAKNDGPNGENVYHIGLNYIYDQHAKLLEKFYEKVGKGFTIYKKGKTSFEIGVPEQHLDDFKNALPAFIQTLKLASKTISKSAQYNEAKLDEFEGDILDALKSTPSVEELQAYNDTLAKNWKEMMANINDPSVQARLKGLGAFVVKNSEYDKIDHQLQDSTKAMILSQDPNATYVTQEAGWKKLNREIVDPSNFILVKVPSHKAVHLDVKDAVARKLGYGTYKDYKRMKRQGLITSGHVHKFEMACEYAAPGDYFMYPVKMYDVANTRVMKGMEDIFNTQPRYVNNLFGTPNDVAVKNNKDITSKVQNYVANNAPTVTTARTNTMLVNSLNVLMKACRNVGVKFMESGNVNEDIGSAIYQYELKRAVTEYKIPKEPDRETFARSIAAAVSRSLGIENAILSDFYTRHGDITDEEAQSAWGEFAGIVSAISSKAGRETGNRQITPFQMVVEEEITEDMLNGSIKNQADFMNFLTDAGINIVSTNNVEDANLEEEVFDDEVPQEEIAESFFKFLDKLERI